MFNLIDHYRRPICLLFLIVFFFYCPAGAEISREDRVETYKQLEVFSNVLSILQDNYVEEIDTTEVLNGAISGLLFSLDPHSSYLPPDAFRELQDETRGSFSGIGIEVTIKNDLLTVVSPISDTPADRAGLKAHDVIIEIDGQKFTLQSEKNGFYILTNTGKVHEKTILSWLHRGKAKLM